jgi:RNA polymerase sigma-70 factor (ECF subfamily)
MTEDDAEERALLSDESTMVLIVRAKAGDDHATEALLERCLQPLRRWAHGRLPTAARGSLDTDDIVQNVVVQWLRRLPQFEPQHVGAMQAYLRQSVINRIRDEVRRITRQPGRSELPEDLTSDAPSQLELAIQSEDYTRYREALQRLRPKDRELIVARIEMQWTLGEIAERFDIASIEAARMAVMRAARRLKEALADPAA